MKTRITMTLAGLAIAILFTSATGVRAETWTQKADMPTRRYVLFSSVVNGKIYAIGGDPGTGGTSRVEAYNPVTDTWTRKADMPMVRGAGTSSTVNGRIYVIGGRVSLNGANIPSVIEYDATTDTWATKTNMMPTPRAWLSSSVVNGKIYVIGGARTYQGTALSTVEEYDPATDTWTRKADMPTARACLSTSAVNGRIYAIGGTLSNPWYRGNSTVEEYNPATNTWTKKADMPTGRTNFSTSAVNGKIYAIGGLTASLGNDLSLVEEYDPVTDTWTRMADMPTARSGLATGTVNGKVYAIGGWIGNIPPASAISTVEEYTPNTLVVDFNGDGIVDSQDVSMMIDHWHSDEPFFDIAPTPLGDGIVDVQDLILLSEHLFEEILPPGLVAYWKLDETEGDIAYDSAGGNFGTLSGNPIWQPESGRIAGTLQFDGLDDYISTDKVLNPKFAEFSVFAWIKGGSPGQVIISQKNSFGGVGATWLGIDPLNGCLMTGLVSPPIGRFISQQLESNYFITDDIWHHVGFVWDGSYRTLYVDGIEVAKDINTLASLENSDGGLYVGTNKNHDAGTFFSGLIDDIRVYNRVVVP
jgi:N-acetylneuraminic acid mutarotase